MRFRLIESVDQDLGDYASKWRDYEEMAKRGDKNNRKVALRQLAQNHLGTTEKGVIELLDEITEHLGFDPSKNTTLSYLITSARVGTPIKQANKDKYEYLYTLSLAGDKLDKEWYYNKELFSRPTQDFKYILNIANVLSDPRKSGSYFKTTQGKGPENIYEDGKVSILGKIKDAGIGTDNDGTIYKMIGDWSRADGVSSDEDMYSIKELLDDVYTNKVFLNSTDYMDALIALVKESDDQNVRATAVALGQLSQNAGDTKKLLNSRVLNELSVRELNKLLLDRFLPKK